jgi:hypothetical protein
VPLEVVSRAARYSNTSLATAVTPGAAIDIGDAIAVVWTAAVPITGGFDGSTPVTHTTDAENEEPADENVNVYVPVSATVRRFQWTSARWPSGVDWNWVSSRVHPDGALIVADDDAVSADTRAIMMSPIAAPVGTAGEAVDEFELSVEDERMLAATSGSSTCYAASGAIDTPQVVNVSVSPDTIDFGVVKAADHRNVPAVDADHTAMWVIVSVAVPVKAGEFDKAIAPELAAANVAAWRVDDEATDVVPDAPGSAVCSSM